MRRDPIICPKCGTEFDPEAFLKSRRTRVAAVEDLEPARPRRTPADDLEDQAEDEEAEDVEADEEETVDLDEADDRLVAGDDEGAEGESPAEAREEDLDDGGGGTGHLRTEERRVG